MLIIGDNFFLSIEYLNKNHKNTITALIWKVPDESIFTYCLHITNTGGLQTYI